MKDIKITNRKFHGYIHHNMKKFKFSLKDVNEFSV